MKLNELVHGLGIYQMTRQTYTTLTEGQIMDIETAIVQEIMAEIEAYVETQKYPRTKEDIHLTIYLVRIPEHIRLAIVQELDNRLPEQELLLKFELYLTLCNFVGDQVSIGYKANYDKALTLLQVKAEEDRTRKQNLN